MRTAALWDEWVEEDPLGDALSALVAGASVVDGVPFLTDVLDGARLVVLIRFGDVWTDVTTDVLYEPSPLTATIGRGSASGVAPPAKASLTLVNPDRRYSQFDPLSPNWPYVRENAVLWVRLFVAGQYFTRFYGEIKGFKQGHDITGKYSIVNVTAAGIGQRLGQRTAPLRSPLHRAVVRSGPVAYWSLEEPSGAAQGYSAVAGVQPLQLVVLPAPKFGAVPQPGSADIADFATGGMLSAAVPKVAVPASWRVEWVGRYQPAGNPVSPAFAEPLYWTTSGTATGNEWYVIAKADGTIRVSFTNAVVGTGDTSLIAGAVNVYDGAARHYRVDVTQVGGSQQVDFYINGVLQATDSSAAGTIGMVTSVVTIPIGVVDNTSNPSIGHIAVWAQYAAPTIDTVAAATGYAGETPYARLARICAEEGIPFSTVDYYVSAVTMGPQGVDSLMSILRECELADAGFLYDGLSDGFRLQGISQRYDQFSRLTVDGTTGELAPLFEALPDDYGRVNRSTVRRKNGGTATVEDTDGPLGTDAIGVYDAGLPQPVNYADDSALPHRANWELHKGSGRPGFRYPSVSLNLRNSPNLIYTNPTTGWLTITPGLMLTVTQPFTAQNPGEDIRLVVEGWTETLTPKTWGVTPNCSRQDAYDVFKIGDSRLGRLRSAGANLVDGVGTGATALTVASTGKPWIDSATYPGMFPFDVEISGIQVTVAAIAGTASPQTFTVTGVSKTLDAGDPVQLWRSGVLRL